MVSKEGLQEFKQIILEEYGVNLTDEQAYQDAVAFLEAFKVLTTGTNLMQKHPVDTQEKDGGNVS